MKEQLEEKQGPLGASSEGEAGGAKKTREVWFWAGAGVLLLAGILVPFALWGRAFDAALSVEGAVAWMGRYGRWSGLAGVLLLVADLFLPIPSTVVMSALGLAWGVWWGGLLSALGSILSGLLGYGLCRWFGRPAARWLAGDESLQKGQSMFAKKGAWLVLLSRWMPVLPEAITCLAGLAGMPFGAFLVALTCGSVPTGFAFAAVGALGQERPGAAAAWSVALPCVLWWGSRRWLRRAF
jgi:uncharacterized membrane protein YdjX (TVP38/TMEM64 family)